VLSGSELLAVVNRSTIRTKYNEVLDRESAYEILSKKIEAARKEAEEAKAEKEAEKENRRKKDDPTLLEQIGKSSVGKQITREITKQITRGLLGILGIKRR